MAPEDKIELVIFHNDFCHICKKTLPELKAFAALYPDKITLKEVDAIKDPEEAAKYGVMVLPTTLILQKGVVTETITGFVSKDNLIKKLNLADK